MESISGIKSTNAQSLQSSPIYRSSCRWVALPSYGAVQTGCSWCGRKNSCTLFSDQVAAKMSTRNQAPNRFLYDNFFGKPKVLEGANVISSPRKNIQQKVNCAFWSKNEARTWVTGLLAVLAKTSGNGSRSICLFFQYWSALALFLLVAQDLAFERDHGSINR